MTCQRCQYGTKEHRCAWNDDGVFESDNWACGTMLALRRYAHDYHDERWDVFFALCEAAGTIFVLRIPDSVDTDGWIILVCYKHRGQTERALVVSDEEGPYPLSKELAEQVCDAIEALKVERR